MPRWRQQQTNAACQCHFAVAKLQRLNGAMQGVKRAGTGRVNGQAWPLEIEKVGHAIGDDRRGGSGRVMSLYRDITAFLNFLVVMIEDAEYHADLFPAN